MKNNFEYAMKALRNKARVHREEWAELSYVVLLPGYPEGIQINENNAAAHRLKVGATLHYKPYFQGCTVTGEIIVWNATTEDLLAEDWHIID